MSESILRQYSSHVKKIIEKTLRKMEEISGNPSLNLARHIKSISTVHNKEQVEKKIAMLEASVSIRTELVRLLKETIETSDWELANLLNSRYREELRDLEQRTLVDLPYNEYLQSFHWRCTRIKSLKRASHRCQRCGSSGKLSVHHRNYKRLWCELPEDLEVLCDPCHKKHHGIKQ